MSRCVIEAEILVTATNGKVYLRAWPPHGQRG
jgi:hypothetical protein